MYDKMLHEKKPYEECKKLQDQYLRNLALVFSKYVFKNLFHQLY